MVYLWFLLALLLLVAALALLWLDRRQRARRDATSASPAPDWADAQSQDVDYVMTAEHGDIQTPSEPALLAGSAGADQAHADPSAAQSGPDSAAPATPRPPVRPAASADAGAAAAGVVGTRAEPAAAAEPASESVAGAISADSGAPAAADSDSAAAPSAADGDRPWTPPTTAPVAPPFAAGSPSSDETARLTKITDADTGAAGAPISAATGTEPTDDTADYYGVVSDSEQAEHSENSAQAEQAERRDAPAKPGRLQRLKERLSGAKKGAVAAGAAAAGAAGAVAAKRRGKNPEDAESADADTDATTADATADSGVEPFDNPQQAVDLQAPAGADRDATDPATGTGTDSAAAAATSGIATRTEPQQQWLASRGFAPDSEGADNVYRGRFRGAETTLLFAERQLHVSLRRPGPNTTEFSLERSSSPGEDGATVEQMNLRSADESTDALLTDQRVVRALRSAPAEFDGATVDPQWAHTSIPVDAVDAFDGTIVTLHGLVAAAAALPTRAGAAAPLDLSHTDPGSAADSRGGRPDIGMGNPSAPQPVATDSDAVSLGDDRLDDALATEVPKASASDRAAAAATDETADKASTGERTLSPEEVPLAPRRPGRPGHLRLVKPVGEADSGAASAPGAAADSAADADSTAESTAASDTDEGSGPGPGTAAGTAAATGIAAALAGVAGRRKKHDQTTDSDTSSEKDATSAAAVQPGAQTADTEDEGDEFAPVTGGAAAAALAGDSDDTATDASGLEQAPAEPNPFDAAMRSADVPANRGDVAADFLPERPAVPRPSRGAAVSFGAGAEMPSLGEPELGRHEAETGEEFKALGASEETPADTRESITEEMRRFESTRVGWVDEPGEADAAQADAAEAAAQRAELAEIASRGRQTPPAPAVLPTAAADSDATVTTAVADATAREKAGRESTGSVATGDPESAAQDERKTADRTRSGGRRRRHADSNPNALTIADLLARESGTAQAAGPAGTGEREDSAGGTSPGASTDPDFVETTKFPQIQDPDAE